MPGQESNHRKIEFMLALKKLNVDQIKRIDTLLASLGDYGEIHLIVQHGQLRFINKVESYRAWKEDQDKPGPGSPST